MRPMRAIASLFALALMMALFHRVTASSPLEARATLALGFLLLAAHVGGELAQRARLPRLTGYLLVGFAVGPAWLGLVRREEVDALRFIADAAVAVSELDGRGPVARALLAITVAKDVAVAILFTLVLANGRLLTSAGALNMGVAGTAILQLVGSAAAGTLLGFALGRYLSLVRRDTGLFLVATA